VSFLALTLFRRGGMNGFSICRTWRINRLSPALPGTTTAPLSPPLAMVAGVSRLRSPSVSLALWQARQFLRRIGRISRAKSTGLSRLNTATSSPAGCPEALSGSPAEIKLQANIVVSIRYFISGYGKVSFFGHD
jgi:hypothetical protein